MGKSFAPFALVGLAGVTWACVVGAGGTGGTNTGNSAASDAGQGGQQRARSTNIARLYNETCAKCHGEGAEGGGGGTPSLLKRDKFDQKWDKPFFDAIKDGVSSAGMEAYGETLSDEEIWGLVVHIRERQKAGIYAEEGITTKESGGIYRSSLANFRLETVIDTGRGLKTPWGIDWLPDGKMLVTSRPGQMHVMLGGHLAEVSELPPVLELGQGGLMDVAVHPDYKKNGWVYLAYTERASSGNGGMTKIVRGKLAISGNSAKWTGEQTVWQADQQFYNGNGVHFGSRIVFDKKGHIFFAVGERGGNMLAQELSNPFGKIFRLKEDGSVPADNPFVKVNGALPGIWSYGHRNQQGLVMDAAGNLWDTEHGPRGGDELNLIRKGANYGWPIAAYSINYNGSPFRTPWSKEGKDVIDPVFRWLPSIGASGLDVMRGTAFPAWSGDLFAGGLSGHNLDRFRVKDGKLVQQEELLYFKNDRVRDVSVGPDGMVYIATNQPDRVIRLVPEK